MTPPHDLVTAALNDAYCKSCQDYLFICIAEGYTEEILFYFRKQSGISFLRYYLL